jgi:DNA-binding NarL/FixJ family response regulator
MSALLAMTDERAAVLAPALVQSRPTRVLVYARDPISRAGAVSQLQSAPDVEMLDAGQASDADVAIIVADALDDELIRVVRAVHRANRCKVVVVAGEITARARATALGEGAVAIIDRREANGKRLALVVRHAQLGLCAVAELEGDDLDVARPAPLGPLTAPTLRPRDIEVLRLLADGCDTAEIAGRLAYSEPTIKNVIQRLFDRLEARNRPHAVAVALRAGLI